MTKDKRFVIALDGPAGSGKSSVASILARELGCIHADSGAMYRTLTLAIIQKTGSKNSPEDFYNELKNHANLKPDELGVTVGLDEKGNQLNMIHNKDVADQIRTQEINSRIKYIADDRKYRDQVNSMLRNLANKTSLVADGRDMGSVVFKDSPWKFYLDASVQIRAKRRLLEMQEKNIPDTVSLDDLVLQIEKRDNDDRNREFGALIQAPEAILIDTSSMSRKDVVQLLLAQLQKKF